MRSLRLAPRVAVVVVLVAACDDKRSNAPPAPPPPSLPAAAPTATPAAPGRPFDLGQLAVFAALPARIERPDNLLTPEKVALGKMLWFDARLSRGQDVSCNTCHDVTKWGADGDASPVSTGTKKQKGTRNAPTVFNAAGNFAQGWDARATLVEDLVIPHAADPTTMGSDAKQLVDTVTSVPAYAAAFKKAFPDANGGPVTPETVAMAIGAYARKLLTPSRWDKFLAGDETALTAEEMAGVGAFMDASCTTCHAGKYVGGAQTQKLGVAKPWPSAPNGADTGRFEVTKQDVDRGVFKVPTLRNVTKTGPYLHDGSVASLEELTKMMGRYQVGKELTDGQVKAIVTFLGALTGEVPKDLVQKPDLPPSGPKTPKAE